MHDWLTCSNCDNEYKVEAATIEKVRWCPFCGSEVMSEEEDLLDIYEEDSE